MDPGVDSSVCVNSGNDDDDDDELYAKILQSPLPIDKELWQTAVRRIDTMKQALSSTKAPHLSPIIDVKPFGSVIKGTNVAIHSGVVLNFLLVVGRLERQTADTLPSPTQFLSQYHDLLSPVVHEPLHKTDHCLQTRVACCGGHGRHGNITEYNTTNYVFAIQVDGDSRTLFGYENLPFTIPYYFYIPHGDHWHAVNPMIDITAVRLDVHALAYVRAVKRILMMYSDVDVPGYLVEAVAVHGRPHSTNELLFGLYMALRMGHLPHVYMSHVNLLGDACSSRLDYLRNVERIKSRFFSRHG